jgi:2-oxoglutarate decarboxylase
MHCPVPPGSKPSLECDLGDDRPLWTAPEGHTGVALISAVHYLAKRKRAVAAVSPQSPNTSSVETDQGAEKHPAAGFGANEWLVDEIYQQYLRDPNSVDRAWWDFFADYKPGGAKPATEEAVPPTDRAAGDGQAAAPAGL